jgi:hypothetical protein
MMGRPRHGSSIGSTMLLFWLRHHRFRRFRHFRRLLG